MKSNPRGGGERESEAESNRKNLLKTPKAKSNAPDLDLLFTYSLSSNSPPSSSSSLSLSPTYLNRLSASLFSLASAFSLSYDLPDGVVFPEELRFSQKPQLHLEFSPPPYRRSSGVSPTGEFGPIATFHVSYEHPRGPPWSLPPYPVRGFS
jgi:hypothetical protein